MQNMLQTRWAPGYRDDLRRAWETYSTWRQVESLEHCEATMALFIAAMRRGRGLAQSSCLTLAKQLQAAANIQPTPTLADVRAALRRAGAEVPTRQAPAIPPEKIADVLKAVPTIGDQAAIELALVTASRWDDVREVRPRDMIPTLDGAMTVIFPRTKGARQQPFRDDHRVHIEAASPALFEAWGSKDKDEPLTTMTTAALNKRLKTVSSNGPPITAHSIKRTAVNHLFGAAATGEIGADRIRQIAKHRDIETTIRYATDQAAVAQANKSAQATRILGRLLPHTHRD